MLKNVNCPNCGAAYNPAKYRCDFCGSFIIMSNENQFNVPNEIIQSMATDSSKQDRSKRPGIYVYGTLLGEGEIPLRLGAANYYKSALISIGGKTLLTESNLYFSSHTFMQDKSDVCIPLSEVVNATYDRNMIISDQISVYTAEKRHKFVVYGGKVWIDMILSAKEKLKATAQAASPAENAKPFVGNDFSTELMQLKKLLDAGIITEEEFNIKKRMILGI